MSTFDYIKEVNEKKAENGLYVISAIATKIVNDMQNNGELNNYTQLSEDEKRTYALNALATLMVEEMDKTAERIHDAMIDERLRKDAIEARYEVDGYKLER